MVKRYLDGYTSMVGTQREETRNCGFLGDRKPNMKHEKKMIAIVDIVKYTIINALDTCATLAMAM